ncbi:MAG: hypothetical protein U0746_09240 [Gemmataceae bacterium]
MIRATIHPFPSAYPFWVALILAAMLAAAARGDDFDRPPIDYSNATPVNRVERLRSRLKSGEVQLAFEEHFGYLRSILRELGVPESSQSLVFSKTSLQRHRIAPRMPRSLYFNDDVYVGFCQRGDVLEFSAVDPHLGTVFYTLDQEPAEKPRLVRQGDNCLICHGSTPTRGVPGHLVRSVFTDRTGQPILSASNFRIDHTSPLEKRWGGWYVTGTHGAQPHMGNLTTTSRDAQLPVDNPDGMNLTSLARRIDTGAFLTPHSDIVALMVLEHQAEGQNLMTQASFQTRVALYQEEEINRILKAAPSQRSESTTRRIAAVAEPLVKYFLFSGEAALTDQVRGTSGFAEEFAARGPRDSQGRSFREFDLKRRMFRYPCSYLIYSDAFDALPKPVHEYIARRFGEVLSGSDQSKEFAHLSAADRAAIAAILRATKPTLAPPSDDSTEPR